MGRPSDTREVLIAEALGDFVKVLDRIEAVKPSLEKSCGELRFTADRLLGSLEPFQKRMLMLALQVQDQIVAKIVAEANRNVQHTVNVEIHAMKESARRIFNDEVGPSLYRVADELRAVNVRKVPAWKAWLTHAAAALGAASCTCLLVLFLLPTGAAETRPTANTPCPSPGCAEPAPPPVKPRDRH